MRVLRASSGPFARLPPARQERIETDDLERRPKGVLDIDRDSLEDVLQTLCDRRLVIGFGGGDGMNTVFLEPSAKDLAIQFDLMRSDPVQRILELQDTYLVWLYGQTEQRGVYPTASDLMATTADAQRISSASCGSAAGGRDPELARPHR